MEPIPRQLCDRYGITSTPHWSCGSCESTSATGARRYRLAGWLRSLAAKGADCSYIGSSVLPACLPDGSSVKREFQALFCEKPEVQSLRLTLPGWNGSPVMSSDFIAALLTLMPFW